MTIGEGEGVHTKNRHTVFERIGDHVDGLTIEVDHGRAEDSDLRKNVREIEDGTGHRWAKVDLPQRNSRAGSACIDRIDAVMHRDGVNHVANTPAGNLDAAG